MASTDRAILLSLLVGCHGGPSPVTADLAAPPPVPAPPDAGTPTPYVPAAAQAELIFTGPQGVATPPTWNAHLPKLAGDGAFLYAAHTHFPDAVAARFTAILRRPAAGGAWTEAARIS